MQTSPAKSSLAYFSPNLHPPVDGPITVRAIMRGFYGNTLRHPGAIFGIASEDELAPWMERVTEEELRAHQQADDQQELDPPAPKSRKKAPKPKQSDDDVL